MTAGKYGNTQRGYGLIWQCTNYTNTMPLYHMAISGIDIWYCYDGSWSGWDRNKCWLNIKGPLLIRRCTGWRSATFTCT